MIERYSFFSFWLGGSVAHMVGHGRCSVFQNLHSPLLLSRLYLAHFDLFLPKSMIVLVYHVLFTSNKTFPMARKWLVGPEHLIEALHDSPLSDPSQSMPGEASQLGR